MQYSTGKHCVYYHRYHLVWSTKYRFKVLRGRLRLRVRDNGAITEDIVLEYLEQHIANPTDDSR